MDLRTILVLPIPFEMAEPTANLFLRGAISESQCLSSLTNMPIAGSSPAGPYKNQIVGTGPRDHRDLQRGGVHVDAFSLFDSDPEYFGTAIFARYVRGR
jgi:hypothetical protein